MYKNVIIKPTNVLQIKDICNIYNINKGLMAGVFYLKKKAKRKEERKEKERTE